MLWGFGLQCIIPFRGILNFIIFLECQNLKKKNYNLHLAHGRENNVSNPSDFADLEKEDSAKIERDDPVVEPLIDLQLHTI